MEEPGWDAVKKYFRKIMNSFALGLLWMLAAMTAGLFFKLALPYPGWQWYNIVFYAAFLCSFFGLIWYYYNMWKD